MNKKVSILIPVYNRKKYISECVQSALNQTHKDIEIIIVDNCSSDGTWDICKKLKSSDCRIKIYQNSGNIGPVRNWMRCADLASGEFSKILFSDDKLHPECIDLMLKELCSDHIGFVYSTARIGRTEEESLVAYTNDTNPLIESLDYLELLTRGRAPYSPGAILLRTKDLRQYLTLEIDSKCRHLYSQHGAGPDLMISLQALNDYQYIRYIDRALVFFRSHEESFSVQNKDNEIQNSYWSTLSLYLKNNNNRKTWIKYLAYTWLLESRRLKKIIAPSKHIRNYEGDGAIDEILWLIYFSCRIATRHFGRKFGYESKN